MMGQIFCQSNYGLLFMFDYGLLFLLTYNMLNIPAIIINTSAHTVVGMAAPNYPPTPELLDPNLDSGHRSFLRSVLHRPLKEMRCRVPGEMLYLDERWFGR